MKLTLWLLAIAGLCALALAQTTEEPETPEPVTPEPVDEEKAAEEDKKFVKDNSKDNENVPKRERRSAGRARGSPYGSSHPVVLTSVRHPNAFQDTVYSATRRVAAGFRTPDLGVLASGYGGYDAFRAPGLRRDVFGGLGAFRDGPGGFRDGPGGFRNGPGGFRDGPGGFRNGPGAFRDGPGGFGDAQGSFRGSQGGFRDGPGGFRDGPGGSQGGFRNAGGYPNPTVFQAGDVYRSPFALRNAGYGPVNAPGVLSTGLLGGVYSGVYGGYQVPGRVTGGGYYYNSPVSGSRGYGLGRFYSGPEGQAGQWSFVNFFNSFTPLTAVKTVDNVYIRNYYRVGSFDDCMTDFSRLGLTQVEAVTATRVVKDYDYGLLAGVRVKAAAATTTRYGYGVPETSTAVVGYVGVMQEHPYQVMALRSGCQLDGFPGFHDCIIFNGAREPYRRTVRRFVYVNRNYASLATSIDRFAQFQGLKFVN